MALLMNRTGARLCNFQANCCLFLTLTLTLTSGEQGVLEVKCPSSIDLPPTGSAVQKKPSFCLEKIEECIQLKRSHLYNWQVLGQMACCNVNFCDFAVLSGGKLFVERISFDSAAWDTAAERLKFFFLHHFGPEVVYLNFASDS